MVQLVDQLWVKRCSTDGSKSITADGYNIETDPKYAGGVRILYEWLQNPYAASNIEKVRESE